MNASMREDADYIVKEAIAAVLPDAAVRRALEGRLFPGRVVLVAAGKAAWQMAAAAEACLGGVVERGVVVTKYGHVRGPIERCVCFEAGHPVPDGNSFAGTRAALDLVCGLSRDDTVLFLLSGGGSALFEDPLVPPAELADVTGQLLGCGASIVEMNTVRKRLSKVKGGRFAELCAPAHVLTVVLSDVLGDPLDMIASGPAYPDSSTARDAVRIALKYELQLSELAWSLLGEETPKTLDNVETVVTGSVRELCAAAARACRQRGYEPLLLTDQLCCQAREAGSFLASVLKTQRDAVGRERGDAMAGWPHAEVPESGSRPSRKGDAMAGWPRAGAGDVVPMAFIAGGETVVKLAGSGLGGRNQELALAAANEIGGLSGVAVFSFGSDGTDGPTDAAGGYVDGDTKRELAALGVSIDEVLADNDSYHALEKVGGLIVTGPTGTNVNDVAVALLLP